MYAHIAHFGQAVEIGGLRISPEDLLHGDLHGVHIIPPAIAPQIPRMAAQILKEERHLRQFCQSPDFTLGRREKNCSAFPAAAWKCNWTASSAVDHPAPHAHHTQPDVGHGGPDAGRHRGIEQHPDRGIAHRQKRVSRQLGTGSVQYAPLARAIIGGLTVSVVLTVFIVPAAYRMMYRGRRPAVPH